MPLIDLVLLILMIVEGAGFLALYQIDRSRDHLRFWALAWASIGISGFLLSRHKDVLSVDAGVSVSMILIPFAMISIAATFAGVLRLRDQAIPRFFLHGTVIFTVLLMLARLSGTPASLTYFTLLALALLTHLSAAVMLYQRGAYARIGGYLFALAACNQLLQINFPFDAVIFGYPVTQLSNTFGVFIRTGIAITLMLDAVSHTKAGLVRTIRYDELTGLLSRTALLREINKTCRRREAFAVVTFDIDGFKAFNEVYGYDCGDQLLKAISVSLLTLTENPERTARLGDDQFALMVRETPAMNLQAFVEALTMCFRAPLVVGGHSLKVYLSIGTAIYPNDGKSAKALLNAADSAMHQAKRRGGTSHESFRAEMLDQARVMHDKEIAIRLGLEQSEFLLYYQPKVYADTRKVAGFEALARWQSKEHGLLGPQVFIEDLERLGLIDQLGWQLLRMACAQAAAWRRRFEQTPSIAVNISPLQLQDPEFDTKLAALLKEFELPAGQISLEITESTAMSDPARTRELVHSLSQLGIPMALDDFGTGYSSLGMLRDFHLSELKIDRTMIQPLDRADAQSIVQAVASLGHALGHALGMKIVAEGVETAEQADMAKKLGCDLLQGYYFDKPLTPEKAESWLG